MFDLPDDDEFDSGGIDDVGSSPILDGVDDPEGELYRLLVRCHDDPGLFNHAILGRGPYWWRQVEICDSVVRHKTTVVETGNSIGKSYLAAGIVLWWLYTRPGSLVITTAPSQTLLGTVLFKELRNAIRKSRVPLGGTITDSPRASPQTLMLDDGTSVLGIATKGVERLSGQHNKNLLCVVDEASGIEDPIWEALASQKPRKVLILGNPLRASGQFVALAKRGEAEARDPAIPTHRRCHLINVPSTDSPDIDVEESERGLADRGFIEESKAQWGENSLWYRTHIRALRPTSATDHLIPETWLDACLGRARAPGRGGPVRISCDLGEGVGRDKTVILVRDDLGVIRVEASHGMGLPEAASRLADLALELGVAHDNISYDALGIGRDMADYLEAEGIVDAWPYKGNSSGSAGGLNYLNLRTAAAFHFRSRIDPERPSNANRPFAIPDSEHWPALRKEVLALKYTLAGQVTKLEPKEKLAARLGHSPDYADALIQSFWEGATASW